MCNDLVLADALVNGTPADLGLVNERIAHIAEAGVAIMINGPGQGRIPPVTRLVAEGVTVFVGSANIHDA